MKSKLIREEIINKINETGKDDFSYIQLNRLKIIKKDAVTLIFEKDNMNHQNKLL